jgi:hypothetical protein
VSRNMSKARNVIIFALVAGFFIQFDVPSYVLKGTWMSEAEAIIGRPATPVSVAGVARRSVRRDFYR